VIRGRLIYTRKQVVGSPQIAPEVLSRYAADAALEVDGVASLVRERVRRHDGVRVSETDGTFAVEIHLRVAPGVTMPTVGQDVQMRVAEYLERMTGSLPTRVDVVVREIG